MSEEERWEKIMSFEARGEAKRIREAMWESR